MSDRESKTERAKAREGERCADSVLDKFWVLMSLSWQQSALSLIVYFLFSYQIDTCTL